MEVRTGRKEGVEGPAAMKPMTSPVYWALLGLLIGRPGYGAQLRQRFERDYGDVLPLSSGSQVYTALNELERRGLIEELPDTSAAQSGTRRQPMPRYGATAEGSRSYRDWMFAQVWEDRRQSRLFVRQLAVFEREPEVALEILERYGKASLKEARRTPSASVGSSPAGPSSALADRLVGEESRLAVEGRLPWVEYARREFGALGDGSRR
jgi:DNA-binding PadR family transcriptional regulator